MIAVIFQVTAKEGRAQRYFDLAGELRPLLDDIDGFISIERFESLVTPGKYLSLSLWRDEAAVRQWHETSRHRLAQEEGKREVFADFRIIVADALRDYSLADRPVA